MENQCFFTTNGNLILVNKLEDNNVTGSAVISRPTSIEDNYRGYEYYPIYTENIRVLEDARPVNPDYLFRIVKIIDINWKVCLNIVKNGKITDTGTNTLELYSNSLCFNERHYISPEHSLFISKDLWTASMLINPKYLDDQSSNKLYNQIHSTQILLYDIIQQMVKHF